MNAPGYTEKDLYWYAGLIAGILIAYFVLGWIGVTHKIVRVLISFVVGSGLGWLAVQTFVKPGKSDGDGGGRNGAAG